ncbi:ribosome assembly RNA-binding protein YhbY [Halothermothrix orenii]|uniref:CRM domain-containing protein n=1 Tax=Halothermothrix orenii (strain H 168 / OCM 544 / DSM 9562) TaxID=373903 RepID=B8CXY9_HALOH|nr:ribosome assembly RNA-binding protein YhbY [Halothermothrix orenii]ACL70158.1 conserved hypothetical protein TIGR00253 [Halothermothrix orenii H 168]
MLTGKQRSYLRSEANNLNPVIHIGKDGITPSLLNQVDAALDDHELIKCRVLKNSLGEPRSFADEISSQLNCDVVQVIGNVFVLFRRNEEEPIYILP